MRNEEGMEGDADMDNQEELKEKVHVRDLTKRKVTEGWEEKGG